MVKCEHCKFGKTDDEILKNSKGAVLCYHGESYKDINKPYLEIADDDEKPMIMIYRNGSQILRQIKKCEKYKPRP